MANPWDDVFGDTTTTEPVVEEPREIDPRTPSEFARDIPTPEEMAAVVARRNPLAGIAGEIDIPSEISFAEGTDAGGPSLFSDIGTELQGSFPANLFPFIGDVDPAQMAAAEQRNRTRGASGFTGEIARPFDVIAEGGIAIADATVAEAAIRLINVLPGVDDFKGNVENREKSARARELLGQMIRGTSNDDSAMRELQEIFQSRSFLQQVGAGVAFDVGLVGGVFEAAMRQGLLGSKLGAINRLAVEPPPVRDLAIPEAPPAAGPARISTPEELARAVQQEVPATAPATQVPGALQTPLQAPPPGLAGLEPMLRAGDSELSPVFPSAEKPPTSPAVVERAKRQMERGPSTPEIETEVAKIEELATDVPETIPRDPETPVVEIGSEVIESDRITNELFDLRNLEVAPPAQSRFRNVMNRVLRREPPADLTLEHRRIVDSAYEEWERLLRLANAQSGRVTSQNFTRLSEAFEFDGDWAVPSLSGIDGAIGNLPPTISHIAAKYTKYVDHFTPAQREAMEALRQDMGGYELATQVSRLDIPKATDVEPGGFYVTRGGVFEVDPTNTDAPNISSHRGKPTSEKARRANSQPEAIAAMHEAGDENAYMGLNESLYHFFSARGIRIADHHIGTQLLNITDGTGQRVASTPKERAVHNPANAGLIAELEQVNRDWIRLRALDGRLSAEHSNLIQRFLKDPQFDDINEVFSIADARIEYGRFAGADRSQIQASLAAIADRLKTLKVRWANAIEDAKPTDYRPGPDGELVSVAVSGLNKERNLPFPVAGGNSFPNTLTEAFNSKSLQADAEANLPDNFAKIDWFNPNPPKEGVGLAS